MPDALTARAKTIAAVENTRLWSRTSGSKALFERAVEHMPMGVGSSFQAWDPYPVYLREGTGSRVVDVDGNEYLDFHNGFGCMVVGHAHPKIAEAIERAARTGTQFAAPTESTVRFAEELCGRFGAESVRFANSGHRGDDERDPRRARRDRPRAHREDRGLVPRPPRPRDVLGGAWLRPHRRPRRRPPRRRCPPGSPR